MGFESNCSLLSFPKDEDLKDYNKLLISIYTDLQLILLVLFIYYIIEYVEREREREIER